MWHNPVFLQHNNIIFSHKSWISVTELLKERQLKLQTYTVHSASSPSSLGLKYLLINTPFGQASGLVNVAIAFANDMASIETAKRYDDSMNKNEHI